MCLSLLGRTSEMPQPARQHRRQGPSGGASQGRLAQGGAEVGSCFCLVGPDWKFLLRLRVKDVNVEEGETLQTLPISFLNQKFQLGKILVYLCAR